VTANWVFDQAHYDARNAALDAFIRCTLPDLIASLQLKTALDLGCGLGHYAELLHTLGLDVLAVDGRPENVAEARRRYPHLRFDVVDAQDSGLSRLGRFDLVFCFGLIYHLENPLRAIRSISEMTLKLTYVEGMVYPSPEPVMVLLDERDLADQGLNYLAFYPSESCMIKMLRRTGFSECYVPAESIAHPEYQLMANGFRLRSVMVGSKLPVKSPALKPWQEPSPDFNPWEMMPLYPLRGLYRRAYAILDRFIPNKVEKR
jgi:SAM-dependent methyltransferase